MPNINDYMTGTLTKDINFQFKEVKTSCVQVLVGQFHSKAEARMTAFVAHGHEP